MQSEMRAVQPNAPRTPESIAAIPRLSAVEARKLLDDIILDCEALLRATEESMTGAQPGQAARRSSQ